jgi:hypothetical protein
LDGLEVLQIFRNAPNAKYAIETVVENYDTYASDPHSTSAVKAMVKMMDKVKPLIDAQHWASLEEQFVGMHTVLEDLGHDIAEAVHEVQMQQLKEASAAMEQIDAKVEKLPDLITNLNDADYAASMYRFDDLVDATAQAQAAMEAAEAMEFVDPARIYDAMVAKSQDPYDTMVDKLFMIDNKQQQNYPMIPGVVRHAAGYEDIREAHAALKRDADLRAEYRSSIEGVIENNAGAITQSAQAKSEVVNKAIWTKHAVDLINSTVPGLLTEEQTSTVRQFLISRLQHGDKHVPLPGLPMMGHDPGRAVRTKNLDDWLSKKAHTITNEAGQPAMVLHTTSSVWEEGRARQKPWMPFTMFTDPRDMGFQMDTGMMTSLFRRNNFGVKANPLTGEDYSHHRMFGMPAFVRYDSIFDPSSPSDRAAIIENNAIARLRQLSEEGKATDHDKVLAQSTFADLVFGTYRGWATKDMNSQSQEGTHLGWLNDAASGDAEKASRAIQQAQKDLKDWRDDKIEDALFGMRNDGERTVRLMRDMHQTPFGERVTKELGPEWSTVEQVTETPWWRSDDFGSPEWLSHPYAQALLEYTIANYVGAENAQYQMAEDAGRLAKYLNKDNLQSGALKTVSFYSINNWPLAERGPFVEWYKAAGYDGFRASERYDAADENMSLLGRASASHIAIFDPADAKVPFGLKDMVDGDRINANIENGMDIGVPVAPFSGESREVGLGFTQHAKGKLRSKTVAYVSGPGGGLTFTANLVMDGEAQGAYRVKLPEVPSKLADATAENILHHAMQAGAQYIEATGTDVDAAIMRLSGAKKDGRGNIALRPEDYAKAGVAYEFGNEKAKRDVVQQITGRNLWYDEDLRFNVNGPALPNPANNPANAQVDLLAAHAAMSKYKRDLNLASHYADVRSALNEQEAAKLFKGKGNLGKRAFVNRMGRAIHFQIDLMGSESGLSPAAQIRQVRQKAQANGVWQTLHPDIITALQDVERGDPAMIRLAAKMAAQNHRTGQDLVDAGAISHAREHYTPRYWFMDQEEFEASLLGQGEKPMVQGGFLDATRAGGRFKTGMGARAKARTYDTMLEGLLDGKTLVVDNAFTAQQKVAHDAAEVLANASFAKVLKDIGAVQEWQDGKKLPEGYEQIKSSSRVFNGLYAPTPLAREIMAMTSKLDWREWPDLIKTMHDFNSRTKLTLLFTSLFHHQAFMRSYYYSIPSTSGEVSDIPLYLRASANSVIGRLDQADKLLMKTKGAKAGANQVFGLSTDVADLVRAGMTLSVGLQYSQKAAWDSDWRESWIEGVVGKFGPKARAKAAQMAEWREAGTSWLFNRMGMPLKAQAGILEYRHLLRKHAQDMKAGKITKEEIASIAAAKANDDFGGLNLRMGKETGLLGGGARKPGTQLLLRLFMLAPDWTESNFNTMYKIFKNPGDKREFARKIEQGVYAKLYGQALVRSQVPTVLFNLLMANFTDESFVEGYKRRWEESFKEGAFIPYKLNFLKADITPVADAVNAMFGKFGKVEGSENSHYYFNAMGHFMDGPKWVLNMSNFDILQPIKAKGSPLVRAIESLWTAQDWRGMTHRDWNEILTKDEKGNLKFALKKWAMNPKFTPSKIPAAVASQVVDAMPIFMQSGMETAFGEQTAFMFLMDMAGVHVSEQRDKGASGTRASRRTGGGR